MDEATKAMAAAIGARVKQERQTRGWTLNQLADASGVSRRMVINVEQGEANPSVGTLLRISDALGIGLPALVQPPEPKQFTVMRNGSGATLWRSEAGGRAVLVAGTGGPDVMELWDWTLGPHDRYVSEAHTPGTEELIHVQQGELTVHVADQIIRLEPGDALSFSGEVSHSYVNEHPNPARFTLAVFEPGVGMQHNRSEASHD